MKLHRFLLITSCCALLCGCTSGALQRSRSLDGPPPPGALLPPPPPPPPMAGGSPNVLSVAPAGRVEAPKNMYNMERTVASASKPKPVKKAAAKPSVRPAADYDDAPRSERASASKRASAPRPEPEPAASEPATAALPAPIEEAAPAAEAENLDDAPLAIPVPKGSGEGI